MFLQDLAGQADLLLRVADHLEEKLALRPFFNFPW